MRHVRLFLLALLLLLAAWAAYKWLALATAEQIYRDRLADVGREYEALRGLYNQAIQKTAVTELVVRDDRLFVEIVTAAGTLEEIVTPYDPSREIHVDYVVSDGRLWIRRIHDDQTPPERAMVIDPEQVEVAWDDDGEVHGLTIYRPLAPGRWVVSVTTNGALSIVRKKDDEITPLRPPPEIREFDQMERKLRSDLAEIGPLDIARRILTGA